MTQYSHSRLGCFENCPKQFEYRYIKKLEVDREGVEAFLGKRVHEILERLYHHVARYGQPPSLSQVAERFHKDWAHHWHDQVEIVRKNRTVEFYQETGERCLENYYRSHYPFDEGETVALEHGISMHLDDAGRYRARGIIDRLTRKAEGRYEIHDYKTSASLPPRARLDQDRQLALYQIGIEQTYPDVQEVELIWHYLVFNRTLRSRRSPEQLEGLRAETIALIDRIEATEEFPARPGPLCRWCSFLEICPEGSASVAEEPHVTGPPPGSEPLEALAAPSPAGAPGGVQLSLLD